MGHLAKLNIKGYINNNNNNMSAYYEDISGVRMDAKLLAVAKEFKDCPWDQTFKRLIDAVRDGGKITSTEITTLEYINSTYFAPQVEESALWALIKLLKMTEDRYDKLEQRMHRAIKLATDSE